MLETDLSRSEVALELHGIFWSTRRAAQDVCRKSKSRGSEFYQPAISFRWGMGSLLSTNGPSAGCDSQCTGGTSFPRRRPRVCASAVPGNQIRGAVPTSHRKPDLV